MSCFALIVLSIAQYFSTDRSQFIKSALTFCCSNSAIHGSSMAIADMDVQAVDLGAFEVLPPTVVLACLTSLHHDPLHHLLLLLLSPQLLGFASSWLFLVAQFCVHRQRFDMLWLNLGTLLPAPFCSHPT